MKVQRRLSPAVAAPAVALLSWSTRAGAELLSGRPEDVSLDGHLGDRLFDLTTVMVGGLFLLMVTVLLVVAIFHRDRPGRAAWYFHGRGKRSLLVTAAFCGTVFLSVDGTLLVNSFEDLNEHFWKWPTDARTVKVEVAAQQWGWNFRYAGPDGKFNTDDDILTFNEMTVPVDTPVFVKLKSKDVIHSFYLPNFRIKQDAIPNALTQMWFQAKKTGDFEIGCAQHCGVNHYKMRGLLHVVSPRDFTDWQKVETADSSRRYDTADTTAHWGWDWES